MSSPAILPPDQNRAPQLLAIYGVQGIISIVIVALRFYVRYAKRIIGVEDWAMLIALVFYITGSACIPVLTHYGLGRHIFYVLPQNIPHVVRWNWIIQPFGIMSQPFGKLSVSIFLLKLLPRNTFWRKWFLYVNNGIFATLAILCVIFTYVQCNPPRALWEAVPHAKCWAPDVQANFSIATTAFGALFDYELSLLPLTILWGLKMDLKRKIGLYMLLGASIFSGISATLKAIQLQELGNRTDVTWETFPLYAWASTELFVNILCGSIPTLKPLWDKWVKGSAISPSKQQKYTGSAGYKLKDSHGSSKQSSKAPNTATGDSITLVHSYGVQSEHNSTKETV